MKPRIFIGSSAERLNVAYSIQESLQNDANVTVWTQGVFQLSSNTLDDLLGALKEFDFAIFVFHPDDISKIRSQSFQTVRDNVIFELGIFIGKLGKEKVFFLIPSEAIELHLPTDLLGVTPGRFDGNREDGNLIASLGPFCNQVRQKTKSFEIENLADIENESKEIKQLAISKPRFWEYLLAAELLSSKLKTINLNLHELQKGLIVQRVKLLNANEFLHWYQLTIKDYINLLNVFQKSLIELNNSFGPPGVPGKVLEIKSAVDRIIQICKELVAWEYELQQISPPDAMMKAKLLMQGWSKVIIDQVNVIQVHLVQTFNKDAVFDDSNKNISLNLTIKSPDSMAEVQSIFTTYKYY